MTPDELAEALQIAKATTEEMVYSRRVLAKAVLWMNDRHERLERHDREMAKEPGNRILDRRGP